MKNRLQYAALGTLSLVGQGGVVQATTGSADDPQELRSQLLDGQNGLSSTLSSLEQSWLQVPRMCKDRSISVMPTKQNFAVRNAELESIHASLGESLV